MLETFHPEVVRDENTNKLFHVKCGEEMIDVGVRTFQCRPCGRTLKAAEILSPPQAHPSFKPVTARNPQGWDRIRR